MRWMEKVPDDWANDSSCQAAKKAASSLVLVNDRAEHGVKLIQNYNALLTKDESQKQELLHVWTEHESDFRTRTSQQSPHPLIPTSDLHVLPSSCSHIFAIRYTSVFSAPNFVFMLLATIPDFFSFFVNF